MTTSNYRRKKECVINIYERYKAYKGDANDGVDIEILQKRIDDLKQGKFTLAVVGQGKVGKSTLINALLRENVLPTGILQCTSAIIEILKSDKKYLKVKYASGKEDTIYDDILDADINEAYKHLKGIGSIPQKYRQISTVIEIINTCLIGSEIKEASNLSEGLLKRLEEKGDCVLEGKEHLIKQYIDEYKSLDRIPVEIQFGFPLKYEFDEMRLVDTPGVNAIGCIEDKTFNFINKAHAIIYLHQIKPIESKSFKDFYKRTTTDRMKEMLFLVLTHTGVYTDEQVDELVKEARNLYSDISPERIIPVDSMLRLVEYDLQNGKTVEQIENESEDKANLIAPYLRKAKNDMSKFLELIQKKSNFNLLEKTIDEFSGKAPDLHLLAITDSIRTGYENLINNCNKDIVILEKSKKPPQEFEKEISKLQELLGKYQEILSEYAEEVNREYVGKDSEWNKKLVSIEGEFPIKLNNCITEEDMRREFEEVNDQVDKIFKQVGSKIMEKLSQKMKELGKEFKNKEHFSPPMIDMQTIIITAQSESLKTKGIYKLEFTFKFWEAEYVFFKKLKTGEERYIDRITYIKNLKEVIRKDFNKKVSLTKNKIGEFVDKYFQAFKNQLFDSINETKLELENLKREQKSNEEIIDGIEKLKDKKKVLEGLLKELTSILEDLR